MSRRILIFDWTSLDGGRPSGAACAGYPVPPESATAAVQALAHEAGIHHDGMSKHETHTTGHRADVAGVVA